MVARWRGEHTAWLRRTKEYHGIIEYQVGMDLKDHLVQPFLVKAQFRQDGPAPGPAES